tara:strand:- start:992 stop:1447 length:456 start_codon:yes stop_codon:yes gene_type:complete
LLTESNAGLGKKVDGDFCSVYTLQVSVDSKVEGPIRPCSSFTTYLSSGHDMDSQGMCELLIDGKIRYFGSPHIWLLARQDRRLKVREFLEYDLVVKIEVRSAETSSGQVQQIWGNIFSEIQKISGTKLVEFCLPSKQLIFDYSDRVCVLFL